MFQEMPPLKHHFETLQNDSRNLTFANALLSISDFYLSLEYRFRPRLYWSLSFKTQVFSPLWPIEKILPQMTNKWLNAFRFALFEEGACFGTSIPVR